MSADFSPSTSARSGRSPWFFGIESTTGQSGWSVEWVLKRNCSMAPGQLFGLFLALCVVSLGIASFFWFQGAKLVMPFAWLELIAVGGAFLVYARHAADQGENHTKNVERKSTHGTISRTSEQPQ
jgi:uncharacterized membrane protein